MSARGGDHRHIGPLVEARSLACQDLKSSIRDAGSLFIEAGPERADLFHSRAAQCELWQRAQSTSVSAKDVVHSWLLVPCQRRAVRSIALHARVPVRITGARMAARHVPPDCATALADLRRIRAFGLPFSCPSAFQTLAWLRRSLNGQKRPFTPLA